MARESQSCAIGATNYVVAPGATLAFLVTPVAGEVSHALKYVSGGSLEIVQAPLGTNGFAPGSTWAGASLVNLGGKGYLMGITEAVNIDGPARYYLMATGATAICAKLISYGPGA
jgi:hypothetical protein